VKKTPLLIALGIFFLLASIIFIFDFKQEKERTPWEFIGQHVVLVYTPPASSNAIVQQLVQEVTKNFSDSLIQTTLDPLLANTNTVITLSVVSKDDFDFAFYTPLSADQKKRLSEFQKQIASKKIQQQKRTFEGAIIYEFVSPAKRVFSFTVIDNVLIASTTSILVEDAVRISGAENPVTFKKENAKLFQLSTLEKDGGNVYVSLPEFFRWIESFSGDDILGLNFIFGKSLVTDFKINEDNALFNGFATDSVGNSFLTLFKNQAPVDFEMKDVISTNAATVLHYGISQPETWYANRDVFLKNQKSPIKDSLEKLSTYKFNSSEFYRFIDDEIGLIAVNKGSEIKSVFIAELKNARLGMSSLEKLSEIVSTIDKDSVYSESYSDYTIGKINRSNFAYTLFWPLASKSSESYFARAGDYVLFSESNELLKQCLDDIDEENTWSKSLRWNSFLETTLQESNIDLFFDVNLLSPYLRDHLTARWKTYFESTQFLSVDRGAIQFSKLEQDYYFTGNFPLKQSKDAVKSQKSFSNLRLPRELTSKPFLVKNHDTGGSELIVQDTLNTIYLIAPNGKIEWKLDLDSKIMHDVSQIDFYKNGKLQYIFITKNKIHIVDRLGRYITGFPKSMESQKLRFSSVVDYDKSKNYRFLVSDTERKIYILDKEGHMLEGWNPKTVQRNLFAPARHYRILGKDYFIAIQDDGLVHIMNRRGESIKGFPLSLPIRPEGDYFFENGKNFSSSVFTVVSKGGMKVKFNLLGKIVDQEALLKDNANSQFSLLVSDDKRSSSFVRIDATKIAAFDARGKLLFQRENPGSETLLPHLFNFDSGKRIFSFTDIEQKLSYVWDEQGTSILLNPMETSHIPVLNYNQRNGELKIFWTHDNGIINTSLRLPN